MKITGISTIAADKYLFVRIDTDSGIYGLGEAGAWGFLDGASAVLEKFSQYLVGKDPFPIEHHWNYLYRSMYFRGSVIMSALSAIDIALWDIKGKALGVPVYELIGGRYRDRIRCYAPVFEFTPESIAEACRKLKERGFDAARLMMTGDIRIQECGRKESIFSAKIHDYAERVRAARESVGTDFDLILDCHRSLDTMEAIALAKSTECFTPLFLEDPVPPDNLDALAEVASKTSIPVASGERNINVQEFMMMFRRNAVSYVRPDPCTVGGITPSMKIAALAEANYCRIVPHNPLGPVSTAACLQIDAAAPSFAIQEYPSFYDRKESAMMKEPFREEGGYMTVPDAPGIGIELVDDIVSKFPPKPRAISAQKAYDGSVRDV